MELVKTKNGFGFVGKDGGKITPAAMIANPGQLPNLAGTCSAGSGPANKSATVTGVGTSFSTVLKVGDYVEFGLATPIVAMIKTLTSATSMVLGDPDNPGVDFPVYLPPSTTIRPYKALWVGKTAPSGIAITTEESVAETKSSDGGEKAENAFSSGVKAMIKLTLMEPSVEGLNMLLGGMVNFTRDATGKIVASSIGQRTGYDFKKNAIPVSVIEYAGLSISQDPNDRLDIFKVAFKGNFNFTKNSSDQQGVELEGYIFEDDTRKINGQPQYMAINDASMIYD